MEIAIQKTAKVKHVKAMTGAIPANGRSGRETTLWTEQKELFDKELVILCL